MIRLADVERSLGEARKREHIQTYLRLARQIHQDHTYDVTGVPITVARHDHPVAVHFFARPADKVDGHFGPKGQRLFRAELKAVLPDADVVRGEGQLRPIFLHPDGLENPRGV